MIHGGDVLTYKDRYHGEIIDFSSNINPLGPPEGLKDVLSAAYHEVACYPDIKYRELKANVSLYLGCNESQVIVGNGALEIINNVCQLFERIVVFIPCFVEYIKRPIVLGKKVIKLPLKKDDFGIDLQLLEDNLKAKDLLILGNPNNPTGLRIAEPVLKAIYELVRRRGAFLLLDEAFFEFCHADYDSIKLFKDEADVCVVRAATKFFALPGLRLGYAFAPEDFIKKYSNIEMPWSVNSYANAAARCIFDDKSYIDRTRKYINQEREYLIKNLSKIKWIKVFKSHANFILIKLLKYDEDEVFDRFIKHGIMIRKASTIDGLDKSYIRVAVKDHEANQKLVNLFQGWT